MTALVSADTPKVFTYLSVSLRTFGWNSIDRNAVKLETSRRELGCCICLVLLHSIYLRVYERR